MKEDSVREESRTALKKEMPMYLRVKAVERNNIIPQRFSISMK